MSGSGFPRLVNWKTREARDWCRASLVEVGNPSLYFSSGWVLLLKPAEQKNFKNFMSRVVVKLRVVGSPAGLVGLDETAGAM